MSFPLAPETKSTMAILDCRSLQLECISISMWRVSLYYIYDIYLQWLEHSGLPYRPLNANFWNSDTVGHFSLTPSESGGVYMHVGYSIIHLPKDLSVHHPMTKMVLFAKKSNGLLVSCSKSVAAKGFTSMVDRQPSSASLNVYEAGWVPSWQSRYAFNPVETVTIHGSQWLPVLFDKSTNVVTSRNASSRQRASGWVMHDEGEMKQQISALEHLVLHSGRSVLPTGIPLYHRQHYIQNIPLHQHYIRNELMDESSDKPRPNSAPAINPLQDTTSTTVAHKRTDEDSEHHSNPNRCVTEPGIFEKTKRSDTWYVATGAAHHATGNSHLITILEVEDSDLCVHAADGTPMPVCGRGNVVTDTVVLSDVYYVPGLDVNLVSVGQLAELDYSIGFARGSCTISSAADTVVGRAHARKDGLYEVDFLQVPLGMP